ncbi:MAG: hypothetical protein HZB38_02825 [Planctomycetes bacterium]|nr:hypothetical protein [Planctomycetota bacterium]
MAAFAAPAQPAPAMIAPWEFWREAGRQSQGDTGRRLRDRAEQAFEHWTQRAEILVATSEADEYSYVSVPPNRTFSVTIRYVFSGKGKPLPLRLDAE